MGWFGKKKGSGKGGDAPPDPPEKTPRQILQEQAMANARAARERLGDDTIRKIAEAMQNQSAGKQARDKIREMDKERIAGHLRSLLDEKD